MGYTPQHDKDRNKRTARADRLSAAREGVVEALEEVAGELHRLVNGAGTVRGLSLSQIKHECRSLRDAARAALKEYEEAQN